MSVRLLVVEGDDRARAALRLALEEEGYQVAETSSAEAALESLRSVKRPDVMLVDLPLGQTDGFTCIRQARHDHDIPIIVVSARANTSHLIAALEAGADDYVSAPFEVKEITARIRALRRRRRGRPRTDAVPEVVLDDDPREPLVLVPASGSVRRGSRDLHLTLTEYRLLCELAAVPGDVLSREVLLERVWEQGFFGDERIVDVHIRRLRTKIEKDPSHPRVVVTVRGFGYRLDTRP